MQLSSTVCIFHLIHLSDWLMKRHHISNFASCFDSSGLSLTPCGRLLTVDPRRKVIYLFERDGSDHAEYGFEPSYKMDRSSKVRFLAVHGEKLVVADLGKCEPLKCYISENSLRNEVGESLYSYCSLKPLWLGMGEVVLARTSLTLHPPSPPTVL